MKKNNQFFVFLALFLLVTFFCAHGAEQARTVSPAKHAVVDFGFSDKYYGWAVVWKGSNPSLFLTNNAGGTWHQEGCPAEVRKVYFLDSMNGWAVADEASKWFLYKTTNGGRNWLQISTVPIPFGDNVLLDLRFLNEKNGWLLVQTGRDAGILVLKTIDSGKTIKSDPEIPEPRFISSFAAPNGNLWLIGIDNRIARRDATQWQFQRASTYGIGANWVKGMMLDNKMGFIVGQGRVGTILKTEDAGKSWRPVLETKSEPILYDVSFFDSHSGCAIGKSLYCTIDAGEHWREMPPLPTASNGVAEEFIRILFLNQDHLYVIREGGNMYQSIDGGKTWKDCVFSSGEAMLGCSHLLIRTRDRHNIFQFRSQDTYQAWSS